MCLWSVETPHEAAQVQPSPALFDHSVGEAYAYVQGLGLKACAGFPREAFPTPRLAGEWAMIGARLAAGLLVSASLAGCADSGQRQAADMVRTEIGQPDAHIEGMREVWSPVYQRAVCGRVEVGLEMRRFVVLMTSDSTPASSMIEEATPDEKQAFSETIWRPICGLG